MNDELVFIVDENNNPLQPQTRSTMLKKRLYCRVSSVTIVDLKNLTVLCQKRSATKDERPNLWITEFGGKSNPKENSTITGVRELKEEVGITATTEELKFFGLEKSKIRRQFGYYYYLDTDSELVQPKPDQNEVSEVRWIPIDTAIENLESNDQWYCYGLDLTLLRSFIN